VEFELKNKALCPYDGGVTAATARQPSVGAVVDFPARAGIGFAGD
jgi:hypothetical protein